MDNVYAHVCFSQADVVCAYFLFLYAAARVTIVSLSHFLFLELYV
jgi:hypothetical protein